MAAKKPTREKVTNIIKHPSVMNVSAYEAQEYVDCMLGELCDFAKRMGLRDTLVFLEITQKAIKDNAGN